MIQVSKKEWSEALAYTRKHSAKLTDEQVTALVFLAQRMMNFKASDIDGKLGTQTAGALKYAVTVRVSTLPEFVTHPMGALSDGRKPVVTSGFRVKERPTHSGVDLFYPYLEGKDPVMKVGDGGRERKWWVPPKGVPGSTARACGSGVITHASLRPTGYRVWIDMGDYSAGYFHLSELYVKVGQKVMLGDTIGLIGDNPIDTDARHLHFELHEGDVDSYPAGLVDPEILLKRCA